MALKEISYRGVNGNKWLRISSRGGLLGASTRKEKNLLSSQATVSISRTVLRGDSYLLKSGFRFTYLTNEQDQASDCRKTNLLIQHLLKTTFCSGIERNDLTHSGFHGYEEHQQETK
jgi:hypothetical protein